MSSSLYRELSEKELSGIVYEALHTEVCSARLLTGGLFNTTYFVDTAGCGPVVLRVGPVNRHLLMPFEHSLMEAEQRVYTLCRKKEIPVSEVLAADTSKTILDRDFMIVRYIPGRPMSEVKLNPQDDARICREIGAAAAKMHSITNSCFGRIVDAENGKGFLKWSDCLLHELKQWESVAGPAGLFSEEEREHMRQLLKKAAPFLDEIRQPRLVHTDLWTGNILVRSDSGRPEFAAIIDADRAIWGDPELDFSSIQWTYQKANFWEGYGKMLGQDRSSLIRRSVYTLLWALFDGYVYEKEYNQPEEAEGRRTVALEQTGLLEELLAGQPMA